MERFAELWLGIAPRERDASPAPSRTSFRAGAGWLQSLAWLWLSRADEARRSFSTLIRFCPALGLFALLPAELQGASMVPSCFSDNMVLQRSFPATKASDVLLWGWSEKGDSVMVEFAGKGKPIDADLKPVPNQPNLRRWMITYGDFTRGLAPSGPFHITITSGTRKKASRQKIENVVVGDVWVFGQKQDRGVPVPASEMAAIAAHTKGRLRFLPARSVNWSNITLAVPGPWREWDATPLTFTNLVNVTCCFGRSLAEKIGDVPVGIIAVPWEEIYFERVDPPEAIAQSSESKSAWDAALEAGEQTRRACEQVLERFHKDILQLKREGKTLPSPPPRMIEPPTRFHLGGFPSLPLATRGGIW